MDQHRHGMAGVDHLTAGKTLKKQFLLFYGPRRENGVGQEGRTRKIYLNRRKVFQVSSLAPFPQRDLAEALHHVLIYKFLNPYYF